MATIASETAINPGYRGFLAFAELERLCGVLALSGIQSILRDGELRARLSAESAEEAQARVAGSLEGEAVSLGEAVSEGL